MGKIQLAVIAIFAVSSLAFVKTMATVFLRYTEIRRRREAETDAQSIRDRLERIEIAVDTIAIEVERLGEHQRFNAQLALNRPDPLPPTVITPH